MLKNQKSEYFVGRFFLLLLLFLILILRLILISFLNF